MEGRSGTGRIVLVGLRRRLADYAGWWDHDQHRARAGSDGAHSRVHFEELHCSRGDGGHQRGMGELGRGGFRRNPDAHTNAHTNAHTDTHTDTYADARPVHAV